MTIRILITGADGQLGQSFKSLTSYAASHDLELFFTDVDTLNICNKNSIDDTFNRLKPHIVVNGAAYTAVDKAEEEQEKAVAINTTGAGLIAKSCAANDIQLIQVSTDYVFSGTSDKPYVETDTAQSESIYGQTKRDGEIAVLDALPSAIVFRTSWVFSQFGQNFLKNMLRLGKDRDQLGVVADQIGAPTYAPHIALAILRLILLRDTGQTIEGGIYHFSGTPTCNWYQFAQFIFETVTEIEQTYTPPLVEAITTADYPTAAPRPQNSDLSNDKLLALIPDLERDWRLGTKQSISALMA